MGWNIAIRKRTCPTLRILKRRREWCQSLSRPAPISRRLLVNILGRVLHAQNFPMVVATALSLMRVDKDRDNRTTWAYRVRVSTCVVVVFPDKTRTTCEMNLLLS